MSTDVQIAPVRTKKQFRQYLELPYRIYKGDPHWVPPLLADMKEKLDTAKNPFFEHAQRELFLAFRNGEVVGRVLALVDDNHNNFHDERIVFFGQYESVNDEAVARALLDAVAAWGRERGMSVLRGPVNLSLNDECAMLLEGFDSPPMVMMPYNPRYYLNLMDACGLAKAKDLYAFSLSADAATTEKVAAIVAKVRQESPVTVRNFNMKKWREEAEKVKHVYNNAWEKNWGFVPWTEHEIDHMIKKLRQLADPALVVIAEDKGQPVGFGFGFPNYNEVLAKMGGRMTPLSILRFLRGRTKIRTMRVLVFGILKPYRLTGISYLLYSHLHESGLAKGYTWAEMSWQLEDNDAVNRFCLSIGGKIYKKYRIYENKLA